MSDPSRYFEPATLKFLRQLKENNTRDWFQENKERYEDDVRHPGLRFISDFGPYLRRISPHFEADPRPVGGSMFRIYRDVRFSKDKSPYKTAVGIQFRHKQRRDVHSPGFYLHIEPGACFAGAGIYHPDGPTLRKIRDFVVENPTAWKRITQSKQMNDKFALGGDSLKRPPKGYDPDHPLIDDLKRKDFVGFAQLSERQVKGKDFLAVYTQLCRTGAPFVKYLCEAVDVPF